MTMRTQERKSFALAWRTFVFDTAFAVFGIFSLFHFLKKSKLAKDRNRLFRERLGHVEIGQPAGQLIWVHAVSVGEVLAVSRFVKQIKEEIPSAQIVFSTVTPTGQAVAESLKSIGCHLIYFPFDLSFIVCRVLDQVRPDLVLLAETEIWPNFIFQAKRKGIPVGIINGRLSRKSMGRYRKISWLMKPVFQSLDFVLVQTEADKERFEKLGIKSSRIHVLGNMKFDQIQISETDAQVKFRLGYSAEDQVLIAGSTHPGEEKLIFETVKKLRGEFPNLKVLVAPRHPERAREVAGEARQSGFDPKFFSSLNGRLNSDQVLIIDRVGELKKLYPAADLVVMGGSFIHHGGQNPIEAAAYARPVISGPYVFNFRAVYDAFIARDAVLIVSETEFPLKVRELLQNKSKREELGLNARQVVQDQRGATNRHVQWIKNYERANQKNSRERAEHCR